MEQKWSDVRLPVVIIPVTSVSRQRLWLCPKYFVLLPNISINWLLPLKLNLSSTVWTNDIQLNMALITRRSRIQPGYKISTSVFVYSIQYCSLISNHHLHTCFYTYYTSCLLIDVQLWAWSHQINWLICRLKDLVEKHFRACWRGEDEHSHHMLASPNASNKSLFHLRTPVLWFWFICIASKQEITETCDVSQKLH